MNDRRLLSSVMAVGLLLALLAPAAAASDRVITVGDFDRVRTDGAFVVHVNVGRPAHVELAGDPDPVSRVTARLDGRTLLLAMRGVNLPGRGVRVSIDVPALRGYENVGAGKVVIDGLRGDVELRNAGAAAMEASGRAGTLTIANDGVGEIDASSVDARDVTVSNDGIGRVQVRATKSLVATVDGVGSISYAGSPARIERHVNGLGRIAPM